MCRKNYSYIREERLQGITFLMVTHTRRSHTNESSRKANEVVDHCARNAEDTASVLAGKSFGRSYDDKFIIYDGKKVINITASYSPRSFFQICICHRTNKNTYCVLRTTMFIFTLTLYYAHRNFIALFTFCTRCRCICIYA